MGYSKSSSKRDFYSNTILPQETVKHRIDNLTLHLKQLEKEQPKNKQTENNRICRSKEIIKIQAEINEKEMKATIVKINKTKTWSLEKINKIDKPFSRLFKKKRRIKSKLDQN